MLTLDLIGNAGLIRFSIKWNWVLAANSDFLTPISLQPNVVDLRYFQLWHLLDQFSLRYHRFTPSGLKL